MASFHTLEKPSLRISAASMSPVAISAADPAVLYPSTGLVRCSSIRFASR